MKDLKPLLPLISSYYGCECSWKYFDMGAIPHKDVICGDVLNRINSRPDAIIDFRLHLKQLEDISEEEAQVVIECIDPDHVNYLSRAKQNLLFWWSSPIQNSGSGWNRAINKLRQLGYCVDSELIEAGIVTLKTEA